jgi:hypothetical protein
LKHIPQWRIADPQMEGGFCSVTIIANRDEDTTYLKTTKMYEQLPTGITI